METQVCGKQKGGGEEEPRASTLVGGWVPCEMVVLTWVALLEPGHQLEREP